MGLPRILLVLLCVSSALSYAVERMKRESDSGGGQNNFQDPCSQPVSACSELPGYQEVYASQYECLYDLNENTVTCCRLPLDEEGKVDTEQKNDCIPNRKKP